MRHHAYIFRAALYLTTAVSISTLIYADDTEVAVTADPSSSQIVFINGDKLHGNPQSDPDNQSLTFESEKLNSRTEFTIDKIQSIILSESNIQLAEAETARIELQNRYSHPNGDIIIGTLHELTPDEIVLKTSYADQISVKRAMVKSFKITQLGKGSYYGPQSINEWIQNENNNIWTVKNQTLISTGVGTIGKDVALTKNTQIRFKLNYSNRINFTVNFHSDKPDDQQASTGYGLRFNGQRVSIITYGREINRGGLLGRQAQNIPLDLVKKSADIDLFINTELGTIYLYIDGKQSGTLRIPQLDKLGKCVSFTNSSSSGLTIKEIEISPWSGNNLPQDDDDTNIQPHNITLNNGDIVPGEVGKVEDNIMIVETEHTPIRIPLDKIKSLNLGAEGEQPIMKSGDVRAHLNNGSNIVIQLSSLSDTHLSGYGQAVGDLKIDLSSIKRIDFNIYDLSLTY